MIKLIEINGQLIKVTICKPLKRRKASSIQKTRRQKKQIGAFYLFQERELNRRQNND